MTSLKHLGNITRMKLLRDCGQNNCSLNLGDLGVTVGVRGLLYARLSANVEMFHALWVC